jgi:hypothetical protein
MSDTIALARTGDKIEHNLMPGFTMTVLAVKSCETDGTRNVGHDQFRVIDPEGNEDWLCAYDVRVVSGD